MMYMMATHAEEAWRQKRAISYNDPIKTGGGCKNLQRCKYINFDRWVGSKCWFHERPEGPMHWESFANCYSPWPDTQVDVARGWGKKKKNPTCHPTRFRIIRHLQPELPVEVVSFIFFLGSIMLYGI